MTTLPQYTMGLQDALHTSDIPYERYIPPNLHFATLPRHQPPVHETGDYHHPQGITTAPARLLRDKIVVVKSGSGLRSVGGGSSARRSGRSGRSRRTPVRVGKTKMTNLKDPAGLPFRDINSACAFFASIGLTFTLVATTESSSSITLHYYSWSSVWFIASLMISLSISIILTIRQVLLLTRFKIYHLSIPWHPRGALLALAILNVLSYVSLIVAYVLIGLAFYFGVNRAVGKAWLIVTFTIIPMTLLGAGVLVCVVFQWLEGMNEVVGGRKESGVGDEGVAEGKGK